MKIFQRKTTLNELTIPEPLTCAKNYYKDWLWLISESDLDNAFLINRFGFMFFVGDDNKVKYLDIMGGSIRQLDYSKDDFLKALDETSEMNLYLFTKMYERLKKRCGKLKADQIYALEVPLIVGGSISETNFSVSSLPSAVSVSGQLLNQLKYLPDGAQVKIS